MIQIDPEAATRSCLRDLGCADFWKPALQNWLGVRVVAIAPGLFDTPLLAGLPAAARSAMGARESLTRSGSAVPMGPRRSPPTSSRTRCSTASSSAVTAPCGCRRA